jgi:N-acetylglutamate synthase-like GNAT family acetyltransferase
MLRRNAAMKKAIFHAKKHPKTTPYNKQAMAITISNYENALQSSVIELILGIQRDEFKIPINLEQQPDLLAIPSHYQSGNGNFWVAIADDSALIGTIALVDIGSGRGILKKMFVRADYRGKTHRVGQHLLDTLLEWAKNRQLAHIYLGTNDKLAAAQRFYEKNNFREIAQSAMPPDYPIMPVDNKFYYYPIL